jgi:hypothetical protein
MMGFVGRQHPSGGFARPINMLASKLCTRVDLYGFSGNMGGKYWARADKVRFLAGVLGNGRRRVEEWNDVAWAL